mmetsp:Transcript_11538/g.40789  ORF Transcript_11538/g.40789 Transcript_11538/m.40789 type:complete len:288 (-) Transcript_11538:391-1254(-)
MASRLRAPRVFTVTKRASSPKAARPSAPAPGWSAPKEASNRDSAILARTARETETHRRCAPRAASAPNVAFPRQPAPGPAARETTAPRAQQALTLNSAPRVDSAPRQASPTRVVPAHAPRDTSARPTPQKRRCASAAWSPTPATASSSERTAQAAWAPQWPPSRGTTPLAETAKKREIRRRRASRAPSAPAAANPTAPRAGIAWALARTSTYRSCSRVPPRAPHAPRAPFAWRGPHRPRRAPRAVSEAIRSSRLRNAVIHVRAATFAHPALCSRRRAPPGATATSLG